MLPGPYLPEGILEDDRTDRGLMFVFTGTSIRRQFEFVQAEWVNNGCLWGQATTKTLLQEPAMTHESLSSHAVVNIVSCRAYARFDGWPI